MFYVFNSSFFSEKKRSVSGYNNYAAKTSWAKRILIALSILMLLVLIAIPLFDPQTEEFRITFDQIDYDNNDEGPAMINPRFQGVDNNGQPYNFTADKAKNVQSNIVEMTKIRLNAQMDNERWIYLTSNKANYNKIENYIELFDEVDLFTEDGYQLRSPYLRINIKNRKVFSDKGVKGRGSFGKITSDIFKADDNGKILKFEGNVNAIRDNMIMKSDEMIVHYNENRAENDDASSISKVIATGNISLDTPTDNAKSDNGVFDLTSNIITLTNNVVIEKGKNIVKGDTFVYNVNTGVGTLNSPSDLKRTGKNNKSRVKGVFVPGNEN